MSKTLSWVFVLLPCVPGLTLLLAGGTLAAAAHDERNAVRAGQLFPAGGAVLLAGLAMGAFVAWRITHPRPEPDEEGDAKQDPPAG